MKGHIPQTTSLYRFAPPPSREMGKTDCAWNSALEGRRKKLRRWQLPKSRAIYSIGLPTGGTRPLARLRAFPTFPSFRHTAPFFLFSPDDFLCMRGGCVCARVVARRVPSSSSGSGDDTTWRRRRRRHSTNGDVWSWFRLQAMGEGGDGRTEEKG